MLRTMSKKFFFVSRRNWCHRSVPQPTLRLTMAESGTRAQGEEVEEGRGEGSEGRGPTVANGVVDRFEEGRHRDPERAAAERGAGGRTLPVFSKFGVPPFFFLCVSSSIPSQPRPKPYSPDAQLPPYYQTFTGSGNAKIDAKIVFPPFVGHTAL